MAILNESGTTRMTVRGVREVLYKRMAILAVQRNEDISVGVNRALERYLIEEEPLEDGRIHPNVY